MKKKIVTLVLSMFLISGCGSEIESGLVIEKYYDPSETIITPMYTGKGYIYISRRTQERYVIKIQGIDSDSDKTAEITVSEEEYESLEIGDFYKGDKQ